MYEVYIKQINGQYLLVGKVNNTVPVDGKSSYIHIRYGTSATPNPLLTTPNDYMGVAVTFNPTAPTTYQEYSWYLIKGATGATGSQGIQGNTGANGTSAYVHIRWGTSATPTTLSSTPLEYIGIASTNSATAPATYNSYTWYKYKGDTGDTGATGAKGNDGITYEWLYGTSTPSNALGKVGDMYLNTSSYDVSKKTATTTWTVLCNIKGAVGATGNTGATGGVGATGSQGAKGDDGVTYEWLTGSTNPATALGKQGDMYLNTQSYDVFKKTTASAWTLQCNIKGATLVTETYVGTATNQSTPFMGYTFDSTGSSANSFGEVTTVYIVMPYANIKDAVPTVTIAGGFSVKTCTGIVTLTALTVLERTLTHATLQGTLSSGYPINSPVNLLYQNTSSKIQIN